MKPLKLLFLIAGCIATAHLVISGCAVIACMFGVLSDGAKPGEFFGLMFFSLLAAFAFFYCYELL